MFYHAPVILEGLTMPCLVACQEMYVTVYVQAYVCYFGFTETLLGRLVIGPPTSSTFLIVKVSVCDLAHMERFMVRLSPLRNDRDVHWFSVMTDLSKSSPHIKQRLVILRTQIHTSTNN